MVLDVLYAYLAEKLEAVMRANARSIKEAATLITAAHLENRAIYAFGSGHSALLVEEMYYRAGGLTIVQPIWDSNVMVSGDPERASVLERKPGYSQAILSTISLSADDVLWLISNSGRNALVVELAMAAKTRGARVIALTSLDHSRLVDPDEKLNQKLYEVADVVLDNQGVLGDAGFWVPGITEPMVPTSTILGAVLVHAVWASVASQLAAAGQPPVVLTSFNVDSASTHISRINPCI